MKDYSIAKKKYEKEMKRINPRYTFEEYNKVLKYADALNLTPTQYCKMQSLKKTNLVLKDTKLSLQMKAELNKIGGNLNQIAYRLNSNKSVENNEIIFRINELYKKLEEVYNSINSL